MTDLMARARKAIKAGRGREWAKDEKRFAACAAGIITETESTLGPRLQKARRLLEAKQIKWHRAGILAAKKFAIHSVFWYPKHPRLVPDFYHGSFQQKRLRALDGYGEEVSPNHGKKLRWTPFPDFIPPEHALDIPGPFCGKKVQWVMIADEKRVRELFIEADVAYEEAKRREAYERPRDVSLP